MFDASSRRDRTRTRRHLRLALIGAATLAGCGGGGGDNAGNRGESLDDPVIPLVGPTGRYSQTPQEANVSKGIGKPPVLPPSAGGTNQYFRLEVPFVVRMSDIASVDPIFSAFSQLSGSLTVTDENGNHVGGIVIVNGFDVFGVYRADDSGFPHDFTAGGVDRNVGTGVILYVADEGDESLDTVAAFGGSDTDSDLRADTTEITQIRIALDTLNNRSISAFYTINVNDGTTGDVVGPKVLSLTAETPDPADPLNPARCATTSRFILRFSEPCVPTSVGKSATLDGTPFLGNMPLLPTPPLPPPKPWPATHITTQLNAAVSPLFLPCDVRPLNSNNLATYIVTPLIDLPGKRNVDLVEVDSNANRDTTTNQASGAIDLSGNFHTPGAEVRSTFGVGAGRAPVNAPVSPEAIYWLPISGRGMGVIDLNGAGFTTNTPGKWSNTRVNASGQLEYDPDKSAEFYRRAAIATRGAAGVLAATAVFGLGNQYRWKVGLGSYRYGPPISPGTAPFSIGFQQWVGNAGPPTDNGNPGTPVPGVNEGSSGSETLVRNADGDVILTGRDSGMVGAITDVVTGDFLDAAIFDTQSVFNQPLFHTTVFWGGLVTRNFIGDPPVPNPPPLRYWVGLQPVDILIDQGNPLGTARLIEGDECWAGTGRSYGFALPHPTDPLSYDTDIPPGVGSSILGPNPQSGTAVKGFTARQQIGNFLYAVDTENRALQVLNSNTFQVITTFDLPDPAGVAVMPDNRYVFTSNAGDDTMSIIGSNPSFPDFHKEIARVKVGRGPRAIACQTNGEDVLVANDLDNSVSIVELGTLSVRKTLTALIGGPRDIVVAPRQGGFGWSCGVYFAYIANFTGNSVVVYESGPDGPQGIGCNDVLGALPTVGSEFEIFEPRALTYSPYTNPEGLYAGGVFVCHRTNTGTGLISHIQFTHQAIFGALPCVLPPGRFFIPPGFNIRIFEITGQWGNVVGSELFGSKPSSVTLNDYRYDAYRLLPSQPTNNDGRGPAPGFGGRNTRHPIQFLFPADPRFPHCAQVEPDRMYVAFEDSDRIQILDPIRVGVTIGEINDSPGMGVRKLVGYYNSQ